MSMPLQSERLSSLLVWELSSPLSRALSVREVALLVGRASIAPLTIEGHLWACRSLLSVWVPSHAESWVLRSPELSQQPQVVRPLYASLLGCSPYGQASIAPLTIEGHLWAYRSFLSVRVPSHSESWVLRFPELCDSEVLSLWSS